jgi:hypothetical protein
VDLPTLGFPIIAAYPDLYGFGSVIFSLSASILKLLKREFSSKLKT